ncbi:MAG: phytoene desaturase [Hydrogenophaga sp.]|uniref:phytoene desaturase n=1 Tax=Hydrogenophaga sp. TaxID=1904254 RepID=UPI0026070777|nr:phytoene desaturase [Hydrogenophaga sp.]MDM7941632.1 phytoene desaturase [Hydrogenophaga sp.]
MNAFRTPEDLWDLPPSSCSPAARPATDAPHAVIIGSGFGGLASAVRLAAKGWRVTVLEKLDAPGGRAYVHRQNGHIFDAGPTIITVPFLFEELWALAGRKLSDDIELRALDPFYRIRFDDGDEFNYSGDPDKMRAEVRRISPSDAAGYERFMAEADHCYRLGFEALGDKAFDTVGDLIKASPAILKMRGWRSLHAMVAAHLKHPKLRMAMSLQSLLIGGNPFSVTCIYSLINALERKYGVHWAVGGTGRLVQGLVSLLQGQGGVLRCNAEVSRIEVDQGVATGVTLASGERIGADIVVSNADTAWTYRHLVEPQHRRHWTDRRVERGRYSMSLFVWYFGTDRQYTDVPHHMMLLGPRYKELLKDIFRRHKLADDFSLYLHRPTASDASMAPAGHDTFYALAPVPHLGSGTDWATQAESFRRAIAEVLDRTVLPGFEKHLSASMLTTPQDFHDRLLSFKGAAFGLEPLLLQSAWFRPHNRSEDVEGLYMVGASTHPGAGVPGVLMSAKALDSVVPTASLWQQTHGRTHAAA